MANFKTETFKVHDDYMTPLYAWEDIKEYIPKDKIIWEAFYGDGESGRNLSKLGFNTIQNAEWDFFKENKGDIIVSNPPFSKCKEVMIRLLELDKPFIIILPASKICTSYFRIWKNKGIQLIIPKKRIHFNKLQANKIVKTKSNSCNFDCFYYCYKIGLKDSITWID